MKKSASTKCALATHFRVIDTPMWSHCKPRTTVSSAGADQHVGILSLRDLLSFLNLKIELEGSE